MSHLAPEQLLPAVLGNELETQVRLIESVQKTADGKEQEASIRYREPQKARDIIPDELVIAIGRDRIKNGSRAYCGVMLNNNAGEALEYATPECQPPPSQVTAAIRAGELVTERGILELLQGDQEKYSGRLTGAIKNHRIIDSEGNTRGCHDNFGYETDVYKKLKPNLNGNLPAFQSALPTLTGAGLVHADGTYDFAQKISDIQAISTYGYVSRYFRTSDVEEETIKRIEIGASDANISDWAVMARFGAVAIFLALLADGQEAALQQWLPLASDEELIKQAKVDNHMICTEGTSKFGITPSQLKKVDCYRFTADLFLKRFAGRKIHPEYTWIAGQILEFGDDFLQVVKGDATLDLLADRADWAAKLVMLNRYKERQQAKGKKVKLGDSSTRRYDFRYDEWKVEINGDGPQIELGIGTQLKQRGRYRYMVTPAAVEALYEAPPPTRAAGIVKLLQQYKDRIHQLDWHHIDIFTSENKKECARYNLNDASSPKVSSEFSYKLSVLKPGSFRAT